MTKVPTGRWQTFVAAPSSTEAGIHALSATTRVGAVLLTPTGIVRSEPNLSESDDLNGSTMWQQSSPVSVEGGPDEALYAPMAGARAKGQVWRTCVLLTLDVGGTWWPLGQPWVTEWSRAPSVPMTFVEAGRVEPESANFLARPPWAAGAVDTGPLSESCKVAPSAWLDDAWRRMDKDPTLEEVARTYLNASRLLTMGHLFMESAMVLLVGVFDALGTGQYPITAAMARSFSRHYCPKIREHPEVAAQELFELTRPGRNLVAHEARLLHLGGVGSGPLGDKTLDLDPSVTRIDTEVLAVLDRQAGFLLKGQLGATSPEPGRCVHS